MKPMLITALATLALAAPAAAQTQLERAAGAAPGEFTLAEQVRLKFSRGESPSERGSDYLVNSEESMRYSTRSAHNPSAAAIFDRIAEESRGDGS